MTKQVKKLFNLIIIIKYSNIITNSLLPELMLLLIRVINKYLIKKNIINNNNNNCFCAWTTVFINN